MPVPFRLVVFCTDIQVKSAFSNLDSVQKEIKVSVSQKATLCCEVSDAKTEVRWYKDGKLLGSSRAMRAESKGKSRLLVVESVDKKDAGEYICEAGTEKLAFKIHVEGKKDFVKRYEQREKTPAPSVLHLQGCFIVVNPKYSSSIAVCMCHTV